MFIEDLKERFIFARWCYLMGETYLSDIEYDELERQFKALYPSDPYSNRPWSFDPCPEELLRKYNRTDLIFNPVMGYMAESIYSVNNEIEYNSTFNSLSEKSRVSFKIDGWNTRVSYYNGKPVDVRTRGRSGNSLNIENVSSLFPKEIPYMGRVAITGELQIPNDKWSYYKLKTGNSDQRSSVRTAIANGDIEYLSFLGFDIFAEDNSQLEGDKYDILKSLGFSTPLYRWVSNFKSLEFVLQAMSKISENYNHLTDGLVIENSKYQLAIRLGAWEEKHNISYVTGYEESYGMYGNAMVVLIHPTIVSGKTCTKINITNIANIVENGLCPGSPIAFNLRSSANSVLDVNQTYLLQQKWEGRYNEYKEYIESKTKDSNMV